MSTATDSSDWTGKKSRVCRVVKATMVPIDAAPGASPANR